MVEKLGDISFHKSAKKLPKNFLSNVKNHLHRELASQDPELIPLFPGYGTHYAYAYVGTPPQRQSLIVDTGSHFTAFPCDGCVNCGSHTDHYFSLKNSTTAKPMSCPAQPKGVCALSQTYTEGSSWEAYAVTDKLWIGDVEPAMLPGGDAFAVDFSFGCQTKETGLFRSQLADGILGLSRGDNTLPVQLKSQGVFSSSTFALCLRVGGGIMTLGGVDPRIHEKNELQYVQMTMPPGSDWFGVQVMDVTLRSPINKTDVPVHFNNTVYRQGKGAIIDSGTTDTYLPEVVAQRFKNTLKAMTGLTYTEKDFDLDAATIAKMPDIVFKIFAGPGKPNVEVVMKWTDYIDKVDDGKYNFRVYLTEKDGVVLGANFMQGHNIVFDTENKRIGIAKAVCNYEPFEPLVYDPDAPDEPEPWDRNSDVCDFVPYTECTARCDKDKPAYKSTGLQDWVNKCEIDTGDVDARPCSENCTNFKIVRGDPQCPDKPWTECSHACIKSRQAVPLTEPLKIGGVCNYQLQTATCYAGACPLNEGDYLLYIDMRVRVEPWKWSYVYTETFYAAMTKLFNLKINSIELLNDAGSEYTSGTKLHFKIRLKKRDYVDTIALHDAADRIVVAVRSADFGSRLVNALDDAGRTLDGNQINRFGWLFNEDIEVLSAIAMPIGEIRDPFGEVMKHMDDDAANNKMSSAEQIDLLLLGVAITAVLLLLLVLYLHMRLRHEHSLYEKDKGTLGKSGEALTKMWAQFTSGRGNNANSGAKREVEMSKVGLMKPIDEDLED